MKWLVKEYLTPLARRAGGQAAAALVAVGMAQEYESTLAAVVAWGIVSAVEVIISKRSRDALIHRVKTYGEA